MDGEEAVIKTEPHIVPDDHIRNYEGAAAIKTMTSSEQDRYVFPDDFVYRKREPSGSGANFFFNEETMIQDESMKKELMEDSGPSRQYNFINEQTRTDCSWTLDEETSIKQEPLPAVEEDDSVTSEMNANLLLTEARLETNTSCLQDEGKETSSQENRTKNVSTALVKMELSQTAEDSSATHTEEHFCKEVKYSCNGCDKVFDTVDDFDVHIQTHCQAIVTDKEQNEKSSMCVASGFLSEESIRNSPNGNNQVSTDSQESEKKFTCVKCNKTFHKSSNLRRHLRIHAGVKPHKCTDCGKSFVTSTQLKTHMRTHTGVRPHTCDECGKSFVQCGALTTHQRRVHAGLRPFICEQCGKTFATNDDLRRHHNTHTGARPYSCELCGKSFTRYGNKKTHERAHLGLKPYTCKQCGKSFTLSTSLTRHERTHADVKPYICSQCGKSFNQAISLTMHERSHTGERPYICTECGQSFSRPSNFATHQRIHTGVKPYTCDVCDVAFSHSCSLRRHKAMSRCVKSK